MIKLTRRAFLQGAAAIIAAPAIIKADRLMNVWTPPEPEIFTGYSNPGKIVTEPNTVNFSIVGLRQGSQVMVKDPVTGKVYINQVVSGVRLDTNLPETMGGTPLQVFARKQGYMPYVGHIGAPYPGGKTKIRGIQLLQDKFFA